MNMDMHMDLQMATMGTEEDLEAVILEVNLIMKENCKCMCKVKKVCIFVI